MDPFSNSTLKSNVHSEKEDLHRISTDAGIRINFSDEQTENTDSSMQVSRETHSKATSESDVQEKKQELQSLSTEEGIHIDLSDVQNEKTCSSI
jgi:hypothetical protein